MKISKHKFKGVRKNKILAYQEMQKYIDKTIAKSIDIGLSEGEKMLEDNYNEYKKIYSLVVLNDTDIKDKIKERIENIIFEHKQDLDLLHLYKEFKNNNKDSFYIFVVDSYTGLIGGHNLLSGTLNIVEYIEGLKKDWVSSCFKKISDNIIDITDFAKVASRVSSSKQEYFRLIDICEKRIKRLLYTNLTVCWHVILDELLDAKESFEISVSELISRTIISNIFESSTKLASILPSIRDYVDEGFEKELDNILVLASTENPAEEIRKVFRGDYKFITNPKELETLALDKGYVYDRSNGDHSIYKNRDGLIVIIPQGRDIGKGLSIRIQKDIDR